jgi:hypothetical protein
VVPFFASHILFFLPVFIPYPNTQITSHKAKEYNFSKIPIGNTLKKKMREKGQATEKLLNTRKKTTKISVRVVQILANRQRMGTVFL